MESHLLPETTGRKNNGLWMQTLSIKDRMCVNRREMSRGSAFDYFKVKLEYLIL